MEPNADMIRQNVCSVFFRRSICSSLGRRTALCATAAATAAAAALLLAAGGCDSSTHSGGPDIGFLNAPLDSGDPAVLSSRNLLPLSRGNSWQMRSATRGLRFNDAIKVVGTSTIPNAPGTEVALLREGKPWRREVYQEDAKGIYLSASQDENAPVMVMEPAVPLIKYPFKEGDAQTWHGLFRIKGNQFPASAFSRVSAIESVRTSAGVFKTARIDTMVTMTVSTGDGNTRDVRFPSVRWLSPGIGFVRRGFADKGQPAFSETVQFNVH